MSRRLNGSIALTKLHHKVITLERKGPLPKKIKGIFIPIEENHLVAGENEAYYMPLVVFINDRADERGQHGSIKQSVDTKTWKEASVFEKEEYSKKPYLGNLKDFSDSSSDASGQMPDDIDVPADAGDDLPF